MDYLDSSSAFLVQALGLTPDKGNKKGTCVLCGCNTESGLDIKTGFPSLAQKTFTDWPKAAIPDVDGIVCTSCSMMAKNHPSKVVSLYRSRLRRCLVTESGELFMIGTNKRLKWMLDNLPNEPFLFMDSRRIPSKFMHHIWCSRVSLGNKGFYYCNDTGNHFVRLDAIQQQYLQNRTAMEDNLSSIYHNQKIEPEHALSPGHASYDK